MPKTRLPAAPIGLPNSRRAFLSGLSHLPLIGGGGVITGAPVAAAASDVRPPAGKVFLSARGLRAEPRGRGRNYVS